jgi:hypothetical protein
MLAATALVLVVAANGECCVGGVAGALKMNTSATLTDVFAILAIAQANWPHDPVAGRESVWRKWSEQLGLYCFEQVATVLDTLARTHPRVPSLVELLGELRARRGAATAHVVEAAPS